MLYESNQEHPTYAFYTMAPQIVRYPTHTRRPCNVDIHRRVGEHIGKYDTLLEIVKKRTFIWTCGNTAESERNTILQSLQIRGKIKRKACRWLDDVKEWTGLSSNEMLIKKGACRGPRGLKTAC